MLISHVRPVLVVAVLAMQAAGAFPGGRVESRGEPTTGGFQTAGPSGSLAAGKLIVADRRLSDSNFFETVILLLEYDRKGALGLVLNRQSEITVAEVFPELQAPNDSRALAFTGGPVSPAVLHALTSTAVSDGRRVLDGVYLAMSRKGLSEVFGTAGGRPADLRVYLGYAGWGEGQLDREVSAGAWRILSGDKQVVFDRNPATLWRREIARTEELLVRDLSTRGAVADARDN